MSGAPDCTSGVSITAPDTAGDVGAFASLAVDAAASCRGLLAGVDDDGTIESIDALWALWVVAGPVTGDEVPLLKAADLNGDAQTSAVDALLILQKVAGLIP